MSITQEGPAAFQYRAVRADNICVIATTVLIYNRVRHRAEILFTTNIIDVY